MIKIPTPCNVQIVQQNVRFVMKLVVITSHQQANQNYPVSSVRKRTAVRGAIMRHLHKHAPLPFFSLASNHVSRSSNQTARRYVAAHSTTRTYAQIVEHVRNAPPVHVIEEMWPIRHVSSVEVSSMLLVLVKQDKCQTFSSSHV